MTSTESLCLQGELFPDRFSIELEGITYAHPEGERTVRIDESTLRYGRAYTSDPLLFDSLIESSVGVGTHVELLNLIRSTYAKDAPVMGVSGYATVGFSYENEMEALENLYNHLLEAERLPGLVVDGGVSSGVLGINGLQSLMYDVPSLGVIPKQGLHRIGFRNHMAIYGDTYQDREAIIGTVPDTLLCVGGADGTRRECQTALKYGSAVILLALGNTHDPKSFVATYDQYEDIENAIRDGTMKVSRSVEDFLADVDEALDFSRMNYDSRDFRLAALQQYFDPREGQSL